LPKLILSCLFGDDQYSSKKNKLEQWRQGIIGNGRLSGQCTIQWVWCQTTQSWS